mmetsp:Transcript_105984/g.205155  ORF Transcript_105984/g.205155 Transcript_105984/m.205155 type:complete len:112 (+) Transcript_105984:38-373(+)
MVRLLRMVVGNGVLRLAPLLPCIVRCGWVLLCVAGRCISSFGRHAALVEQAPSWLRSNPNPCPEGNARVILVTRCFRIAGLVSMHPAIGETDPCHPGRVKASTPTTGQCTP